MRAAGQIVVPPALSTGDAIAAAIDPLTTNICLSTPTGCIGTRRAHRDWASPH